VTSEAELLRTEAPPGWQVKRIKRLATTTPGAFTDGDWIESPYITNEGVRLLQTGNVGIGQYKEQGYRFVTEETFRLLRCTEVRPGDVLICRLADPVGRACIAPDLGCRMITSVDVAILKMQVEHDPRFLVYYLSSERYLGHLEAICRGGTRDRVSRSMLGDIPVLAPPRKEQDAIANFLDRKTAAIDALIAKKERLIELLQEKRQALITQAVTKGLDPNVPMKESGMEWLGTVPAHWEVRPLKRLLAHGPKNGISPPPSDGVGVPSFSISAVRDGRVDVMTNLKEVALPPAEARVYRMRKHDLLLVRGNGNLEMVGACGLVDEFPEGCTYPDILMLMRPSRDATPEFLVAAINSPYVRAQIELAARTSNGTYKVSGEDVRSLLMVVPPVSEQQTITARVIAVDQTLGRLLGNVRLQTEKLREYRQALITAAVTGKIDVSKEAA